MTTPLTLDGAALRAAREAVYWLRLVPACAEMASGLDLSEDPEHARENAEALTDALALQRRLGWPHAPLQPTVVWPADVPLLQRLAREWHDSSLERVRDGDAHPLSDGGDSAPRSREDARGAQLLQDALAR